MTPENSPEQKNFDEKIQYTLNAWKTRLLDLTKRNRALNFKTNKVSTVTIVDEKAAEVFRHLVIKQQSLKFQAKPEPEQKKENPASTQDPALFDEEDFGEEDFELAEEPVPQKFISSVDFEPYETSDLAEQHTDDILQTNAAPEKLDKALRRIEERARLSIEEQGVNALFLAVGMLRYNESKDSGVFYKAPLILIPVELKRKSARTGYTITATDDEIIVNPSLIEYLQRNYTLSLPELPDSGQMTEEYNLQDFFITAGEAIDHKQSWSIRDETQLGLFSFQKLAMYKDIEKNAEKLATHPIVSKIITRSGDFQVGLPKDIGEMELDEEFPPEDHSQIVDADSSQLRAIATVARNHNLVLEGPPGTGKSQTITNLIAQALADGKSVLFVAEKMAALEVVYRRLVNNGLGEFCLELHSNKANKRSVMKELGNSLDASLEGIAVPRESTERLPRVRQELTDYVKAVHKQYGTLGQSPYQAYGEVGKVLDAPKAVLQESIFEYTKEKIDDGIRLANDLAVAAREIGSPAAHPWRDTSKEFYSEHDLDRIKDLGQALAQELEKASDLTAKIEKQYGLPPVEKLSDVDLSIALASVMAESPGAPMEVLSSEKWNSPPPEAQSLIQRGRQTAELKKNLENKFTAGVFEQDPQSDIDYIEQKLSGFFSFLAFLDGRYRTVKKRWLSYRLDSYQENLLDQAVEMKKVSEYLDGKKYLESQTAEGTALFGALWKGEESDWTTLENYISWVLKFRQMCVDHGLHEQSLALASQPEPDVSLVKELETVTGEIRSQLGELGQIVGYPADYFNDLDLPSIRSRITGLVENLQLAQRWAAFEGTRQKVEKSVLGELLPLVMTGQIKFKDLDRTFLRAFYQKWLTQVIQERPELRSFHTSTHEQRIKEFKELDERVFKENRAELVSTLRERLQNNLRESDVQDAMRFLRSQLSRQRNLAPLRVTMKHSLAAIRAIKPCFMMSPLTVAQLLDSETAEFDLVIFDEASQLPTEDAIGAILRGKQLVVVGDPKQLPPTNFFAVQTGQVNAPIGEDGLPLFEDSQSILEEVMGAGVPQSRLKWHYRSAHESLITFSNVTFYDADLYTFPSVERNSSKLGLHFEYVEEGVYEGRGLNMKEARRVAAAVVEHIRQHPELSLGVGTFNLRQQIAIQDVLEQHRREDPSIESFFDRSREEPFFVKNLENIQGDERDVIFLSITYAKSADGKMRYNLGPINGENGWRRLNVLTTRAKNLMRVFSSIRSDEINLAATTSHGASLLKDFLTYAEHKRLDSPTVSALAETDSPFEREVLEELQQRNFNVVPQVGVCGYRIDLGVLDDQDGGRFICGIECDGVSYHSSQAARDRDRLRQQVLEGRGWDIHRIWSTDWFKDRNGQIERLLNLINESRQRANKNRENPGGSAPEQNDDDDEAEAFFSEVTDNEVENIFDRFTDRPYERPEAEPYKFAPDDPIYSYQTLVEAPPRLVAEAIMKVVEIEAPLHIKDLTIRVAAMWGQRSGKRIVEKIEHCLGFLQKNGLALLENEFVKKPNREFVLRSRNETNIPAERIAPEEIREAILTVLKEGKEFTRQDLVNEVRAVFGFSRTGPALQQVIDSSVEDLLVNGIIGEGSVGVALRN